MLAEADHADERIEPMAEFDHGLIDEQIDYYRRRAPEYDGSTTPLDSEFADEGQTLDGALAAFMPRGEVLEVACGTGSWTRAIARYADEVTALDSSPEMIRLARAKVPDASVRFIEANFFSWTPDRKYDAVLFANWLSHVPPALFEDFWTSVGDCLTLDGRVFFIDEAMDAWRKEQWLSEDSLAHAGTPLVSRSLRDGSTHRVVKVFWNPRELEARLDELGWDVTVTSTGAFFWGQGRRSG